MFPNLPVTGHNDMTSVKDFHDANGTGGPGGTDSIRGLRFRVCPASMKQV